MPYEDESLSIPPEPTAERHRRRGSDRINWRRVALYVLGSLPVWGPGAWQAVSIGLEVHRQWLVFVKMPDQIKELEDTAKEHDDLVKRLASLERYRCILGYDPGGKLGQATILPRDRRSECRASLTEMAQPAPAP